MKTTNSICTIIFFFLGGCAPSTQITGSWKSPKGIDKPINSIIVTSLTENTNARQTVENDLASALSQSGIKTVKSLDVLPPSFTEGQKIDREAMLEKIKETSVDAILTVALIDEETENRYVPGTAGYDPMIRYSYYSRFWGYYSNWLPVVYNPGYYTQEKIYFIETNLYNASNEELLWSAQSETYSPNGLTTFSKEFATVVRNKMHEDGILKMEH